MNKKILFFISFLSFLVWGNSQNGNLSDPFTNEIPSISHDFNSIGAFSIPKITLNEYQRDRIIPKSVNNCYNNFYPWPFYQTGMECGQSTSITQIFNYEICFKRGWNDINFNLDHKFPAHFVWNFCNNGIDDGIHFLESWRVVECSGTTNYTDWGGYPQPGQYKIWISGYDKYYRAMQNRINEVFAMPTDSEEGILTLKHWLYDHINGDPIGGLANFNATFKYPDHTIPEGFPGAGKYMITEFTNNPNHAYIILGYNDTIGWDYNNDHQLTNHIDLNNDGVIDIKDWEKGCFIISHTSGPSWGDYGQCFIPYRLIATNYTENGVWGKTAYSVKVKEQVLPQYTLKASVTYNKRGRIKIYYGYATDTNATSPSQIFEPYVFNYQGGDFYMKGGTTESDKTIEFGIDLSPLLNLMDHNNPVRFFILIDEKDMDNSGNGTLNYFSIMDYTHDFPIENAGHDSNLVIRNNNTTSSSFIYHFDFERPVIQDSVISVRQGIPFSVPVTASGGIPNYTWELSKDYQIKQISTAFPSGGTPIYFDNIDSGSVRVDLPFSFPFYQHDFNTIYISTNGYINFAVQTHFPFVQSNLIRFETTNMMAPFLTDLILLNAKIAYQNNKIIIICNAKIKNQPYSFINYAVTLNSDGSILFHYGDLIYSNISFISGISNGNKADLKYTSLTHSNCNQISGQTIQFIPINKPSSVYLTQNGILYGTCFDTIPITVYLKCKDNNGISTQKKVMIQITPGDGLNIDQFNLNNQTCNTAQIGNEQNLDFFIENKKDTTYTNVLLNYHFSSSYINSINNQIIIDSINPFAILDIQNQVIFTTSGTVPDHTPIRFNWMLTTEQDTLNSGFYSFFLERPLIDLVDFEFETKNNSGNSYNLEINLKNLKTCPISNIHYKLTLSDDSYSVMPIDTSSQNYDGFESKKLIYSVLDPEFTFSQKKQIFNLEIYNNGSLLQTEIIPVYNENHYVLKPNPTTDFVEITSLDPNNRIQSFAIFNPTGSTIISGNPNTNQFYIDCRDWPQGIYIIKIMNQNSIINGVKLIKL
jgi:hypothetical protein